MTSHGRGNSLKRMIEDVGIDTYCQWKREFRNEYDYLLYKEVSKKQYVIQELKDRYVLHRWKRDGVKVK